MHGPSRPVSPRVSSLALLAMQSIRLSHPPAGASEAGESTGYQARDLASLRLHPLTEPLLNCQTVVSALRQPGQRVQML